MLPALYDLPTFLTDAQSVVALFGSVAVILAALFGAGRLLGLLKRVF